MIALFLEGSAEMRADFARFPRCSGRVTHFAMATEAVRR